MIDIDHFKQVNDTHGHLAGDAVLRQLAKNLEQSIRKSDLVARYGGEEFTIILPMTAVEKAQELAERLRIEIEGLPMSIADEDTVHITISIGIASIAGRYRSWEKLLSAADQALYKAKKMGRNQVQLAGPATDKIRTLDSRRRTKLAGRQNAQKA